MNVLPAVSKGMWAMKLLQQNLPDFNWMCKIAFSTHMADFSWYRFALQIWYTIAVYYAAALPCCIRADI